MKLQIDLDSPLMQKVSQELLQKGSLTVKAQRNREKEPKPKKRQKSDFLASWTVEELVLLETHYRAGNGSAKELSETLLTRFSKKQIAAKASQLQKARQPWSEQEEELLTAIAGTMPINDLVRYWRRQAKVRGFPVRSKNSLQVKLSRMGESRHPDANGINAKSLARALNIHPKLIYAWIKSKKLKSQWVGEEGGEHYISYRALACFVLNYPGEFQYLNLNRDSLCWLFAVMRQVCSVRYNRIRIESDALAAPAVRATEQD
jgi:hypothetical protein